MLWRMSDCPCVRLWTEPMLLLLLLLLLLLVLMTWSAAALSSSLRRCSSERTTGLCSRLPSWLALARST